MPDENFRTILQSIARQKSSIVTVFADFCRIAACASALQTREDEYFEAIKSYSKEELSLIAKAYAHLIQEMEQKPFCDVLGPYYIEIASHSSKQARGEFYTPPEVSELLARISMDAPTVIAEGKAITVNDPCCGSGGMLLALAKQFSPIILGGEVSHVDLLRVTCQDINPVAVDMCYLNTTMWGIPATMILGNGLNAETNKVWSNIHWFRVEEDQRQALLEMMQFLKSPPTEERRGITEFQRTEPVAASQAELDLFSNPHILRER
ncbi:N-6 DNA methylase [Roseibacillus persicicus]|uniref:N-6 DNA methylase n=1 Tax=Roseibacillus persicicus TaxID=454148 RepID=UPI00398B92C6